MFVFRHLGAVTAAVSAALGVATPAFAQTCAPVVTGTIVSGVSSPTMSGVTLDDCSKAQLTAMNEGSNTVNPHAVVAITKSGFACSYTIKGLAPSDAVYVHVAAGLGMHFAMPVPPRPGVKAAPGRSGGITYGQFAALSQAASTYLTFPSPSLGCNTTGPMKPLTITPDLNTYKPA